MQRQFDSQIRNYRCDITFDRNFYFDDYLAIWEKEYQRTQCIKPLLDLCWKYIQANLSAFKSEFLELPLDLQEKYYEDIRQYPELSVDYYHLFIRDYLNPSNFFPEYRLLSNSLDGNENENLPEVPEANCIYHPNQILRVYTPCACKDPQDNEENEWLYSPHCLYFDPKDLTGHEHYRAFFKSFGLQYREPEYLSFVDYSEL